jgi:hypothetical protein
VRCQGNSFITHAKYVIVALALAAAIMLLTSCGSGSASQQQTLTIPPTSTLKITTSTTLYPVFDPTISDYVATTPSGSSLQVTVNAPAGTQVSVDGYPSRSLAFTTQVKITAGQSFPIVVNSSGSSKTYYVRCLPTDFPTWTTERPGTPQAEYYVFAPDLPLGNGATRQYIIIADGYGVPVWWYRSTNEPRSFLFLPNSDIAWIGSTTAEEHQLNGALVRTFSVDSLIGGIFDFHEIQQLPNGDYIIIADVTRGGVDLTAYGGIVNDSVIDNVIEEIAPNGALVWHWSAMDHISAAETDPVWWSQYITNMFPADPYHMNSVEPDGNGFVVSFRHLDAVIRIDKASGNIVWKLGGTHGPVSLTFNGDTYGNFGGQHDARMLPDGTLTVHDNGTPQGRAPRAVRYSIDTVARTATFAEQVNDPDVSASECCGSARKMSGGDWVMSWGQNPVVTELTPAGGRVFRMTFKEPYFSYRALPVAFGVLSRAALRSGMDAKFPRHGSGGEQNT